MSYSTKKIPKKFSTTTNKQTTTQKTNKNSKGLNATQRTVDNHLICDQPSSIARKRLCAQKKKNEEVKKFRDIVREVYHQSDRLSTFVQTSVLSAPPEVTSDRYLLGQYRFPKDYLNISNSELSSQTGSETKETREYEQEQEHLMEQLSNQIENKNQKQKEHDNFNENHIKSAKHQVKNQNAAKAQTQNEEKAINKDIIVIDGSQYLKEIEEEEEDKENIENEENKSDDFNENNEVKNIINSHSNENNEDKKEHDNEIEEESENDKVGDDPENNNQHAEKGEADIQEEESENEAKDDNEVSLPKVTSNFNKEVLEIMEEAGDEIEAEIEIEADIIEDEAKKEKTSTNESDNNSHKESESQDEDEAQHSIHYQIQTQKEPSDATQEEDGDFNNEGFATPVKTKPEKEIQERNVDLGNEILTTQEKSANDNDHENMLEEEEIEAGAEIEVQEEEEEIENNLPKATPHIYDQSNESQNKTGTPIQTEKSTHHHKNKALKNPNSPSDQIYTDEYEGETPQNERGFDIAENLLDSGDSLEDQEETNQPKQTQNENNQGQSTPDSKQRNFNLNFSYNDINHYNPNAPPLVSPRSYKSPFSPQARLRDQQKFLPLDPDDPSLKHTGEMLLEISVRPFLYNLSIKYGQPITRLKEIPEYEFKDWKSMGFQWIWLYGVWKLGENCLNFDLTDPYLLKRYNEVFPGWQKEDVIGYPLSIVSYQVNPEIGDIDDLIWFRDKLKESKIKLMLDFVPNHTAIDAPEVTEHPEYYIHASSSDLEGKIDPKQFIVDKGNIAYGAGKYMPPMRFTAQLNIFNEKAKKMQISNLISISNLCDGVRVHLAQYLITEQFSTYWKKQLAESGFKPPETEFWTEAIDKVRSNHPDFVMMAETYGIEHQMKLIECGFSYIYEKELIDHLVSNDVSGFRNLIFKNHFITDKMVHFIENHDEKRMVTRFFGNRKAAMTASAALLTLPGIRLINMQQWLGYRKQIDVNLRRAEQEECDIEIVRFYNRLFLVLESNALRYGTWEPLKVNDDDDKIIAWKWVKDDQHILVTINFNNCWSQGKIICEDASTDNRTIYVREMISETYYTRDPYEMRKDGLVLSMEPYQAQIFEY